MTFYVYSKMSAGVDYNRFEKGGADLPVKTGKVTIHGGAGIANKNLVTPNGTVTKVTDEEMEFLNSHDTFVQHKKNGSIKVEKKEFDVEKVVANMGDNADPSSPLTPTDFENVEEKTAKPQSLK